LVASDGAVGKVNVVLDVGVVHQVSGLLIWNYNEKDWQHRGAKDIEVSTSADATTFAKAGSFTLKPATGQNGEAAQTIALPAGTSARYVKILILSNFGSEPTAGLAEVAVVVGDPVATDTVLK
jgi:hypothetical protein